MSPDPVVSRTATFAVLARFAGLALETAFYVAFWRARGGRLPFWRYASQVMLGSLLDLQAIELVTARTGGVAHAPWLVAGAGLGAAPPGFALAHPLLVAAFANAGLLALARMLWVSWAQAATLARRWRGPLALTFAMWLVTRVAIAAAAALVQGRSVVR